MIGITLTSTFLDRNNVDMEKGTSLSSPYEAGMDMNVQPWVPA
jgi:hypothetical protein